MGYSATAPLAALFDVEPARRAARRMTRRAGRELRGEVRSRTPVAEVPAGVEAAGDTRAGWIAARGGREPGTLRGSWELGDVEESVMTRATGVAGFFVPLVDVAGIDSFSIDVWSDDPAAPHVEWDTSPHLIRARRAESLRFWDAVGKRFRREVEHPGTTGVHMMRDSLAEVEVSWRRGGEVEVERWARETARLVA